MFLLIATTFLFVVVNIRAENTELVRLIERIHKESNLAAVCFLDIDGFYFHEYSKVDSAIPSTIFTSFPKELNQTKSFNRKLILVVPVVDTVAWKENPQYLTVIDKFIKLLLVRKYVILVTSSYKSLEEYFWYFKKNKFIKIFGIVDNISYAFLPYADQSVQRISSVGPLPDDMKDLNGFSFRTTIQTDIPRAFWYKSKDGRDLVGGSEGQLFLAFIHKHNATFNEVIINNSSQLFIPGIMAATENDEIDISMNPYSPLIGFEMSYPIKFLSWVVLTPINGFLDPNQYFLRPFTKTVWAFIGFTIVYIIIMDLLKDFYTNAPIKIWIYINRTLLTLLSMPAERRTNSYRLHIQVILLAFILGNLYNVHLTSFLTARIRVGEYETIKDLITNNVRIMMADYEWAEISDPDFHVAGLENIVELTNNDVYTRERNSMKNTSFAYAVGTDKVEYLMGVQMNFNKPRFYILYESLMDYYLGFILVKHSPFIEILNTCILQSRNAGLIKKWTSNAIAQAYATHKTTSDDIQTPEGLSKPLTLGHLGFAWNTLMLGLMIAMVVFIAEKVFTVLKVIRF